MAEWSLLNGGCGRSAHWCDVGMNNVRFVLCSENGLARYYLNCPGNLEEQVEKDFYKILQSK